MTESSTSVRLSKAAKEFNVGTATIVEFLGKKGHIIDPNPNTRLTAEMYELVLKEYSLEKKVKEVSKQIEIGGSNRKTITAELVSQPFEEEEDIDTNNLIRSSRISAGTAKAQPTPTQPPKPEPDKVEPVPAMPSAPPPPEPVVAVEPPKPVIEPVKEAKPDVPVEETASQPKPTTETSSEVSAAEPKDAAPAAILPAEDTPKVEGELKIIGKIDLDSLNQKTKPGKKSKEQRIKESETRKEEEKARREQEAAARKQAETAAKAAEAAKAPPKQETPKETPAAPETPVASPEQPQRPDNFLATRVEKLAGPKVLGKIDVSSFSNTPAKPKPVATSSDPKPGQDGKKKKRKRIKNKGTEASPPAQERPGQPRDQQRKGKPAPKKEEKVEVSDEEIQRQIKETLARLTAPGKSKAAKHRRLKREAFSDKMAEEMARQEEEKSTLKVTEFVTVNELATMMNVPVTKVIGTCMSLGLVVSINQRLDAETLTVVADEFGFKVEFTTEDIQEIIATTEEADNPEDLVPRAPIVTVMGHVDHGKTLLLDYIRKSNVVAGEAGGITQHIGAYEVVTEKGKKITFLDTPGHEAFTAMRARGAKLTDVAIIVIAADDSVMPQTREAINHAQAAGVPIVFAINKIDKPSANPERIREQLANMNFLVEEWGGKYQSQEVSAKSGFGIDLLLEKVLLEAEILDLKANPKKHAKGTVIESALDKGRGYVAKILVQDGSLKIGDLVVAGTVFGKVKAMFNERNQTVKQAGPSTPVLMLGLTGAPQAGDAFVVMKDEKEAKSIAMRRQQLQREQGLRTQKHITLDEIGRRIAIGDFKELNLIVKGDVDGSVEALSDSLLKLSTDEVQVNVIHKSVGAITESDIMLASASNAIVIGFQVRPSMSARRLAETEEIDIRLYSIIYTAIEEIKAAIEGMLSPEIEEVITCNLEVRETFKISKVGTVAGCMVLDGKITRNTRIRLIRDGIVIYTGNLGSLKRFKDDVKEVSAGYECGLNIDGFNDLKVGDIIEGFTEKEVMRKL
ncbi:MAG TPA: translation initiation factor IF-2 [Bacteroidales bacterium]|nr:translation initiation factor IF-2 [Bacteroidales bacterium]